MSTPADQLPPVPTTPDFFIPQVPFKQLPFPWNDLTDVPQPDAPQYYPDHAPNVVATVAAMHPTNQQGQTLNTDGNHALLVKDVGTASGGGPVEVVPYDYSATMGGFSQKLLELGAIGSVIYGITASFVDDFDNTSPGRTHGQLSIYIYTANGTGHCRLINIPIAITVYADGDDILAGHGEIWYGNGMILSQAQNEGSGNYSLYADTTNIGDGGFLELCVWCSA